MRITGGVFYPSRNYYEITVLAKNLQEIEINKGLVEKINQKFNKCEGIISRNLRKINKYVDQSQFNNSTS